jgi:hypothetical protein
MQTMFDIMSVLVGTPSNDYEHLILYCASSAVTVVFIFAVIAIMYFIGSVGRGGSR